MRARLFVALVLGLGLVAQAAPGLRVSADQRDSTIIGNPACVQDFPSTTSPDPNATVVMCDLDNPRGLVFGPIGHATKGDYKKDGYGDGSQQRGDVALYVAEAGRGGLGLPTCDLLTGTDVFTGAAGGTRCYGPSGAISRLWNGIQTRVVTGLPSHSIRANGGMAIGPHDIALVSRRRHDDWARKTAGFQDCDPACAYVTIGLRESPGFREETGTEGNRFLKDFAKLVEVQPTGTWKYVADLGTYETQNDPDQEFYDPDKLDTNPYALLATPGGRALVVTDAGGNSMLRVGANGKISTIAAFAPHPDDAVPTSIAVGPDGAYYVGSLSGIPVVPGSANLYRVGRGWDAGESPEVCLTGFTTIIDIAFDKHDNLYVLEYLGTLFRVDRDKHATRGWNQNRDMCAQYAGTRTPVVSGLSNATSVAVGPDGALYISNRGTNAGRGQVIRYLPPPQ